MRLFSSRLDRAPINHLWISLYPSSYVERLGIIGFDHALIIIDTNNSNINYNYR